MSLISQEDLNRVRSSANIVDVVGNYISLTPKGKNFFAICPFHEDHNPSMSVSPDKQIYRCFVCGNTGNVFTFVEKFLGVSFAEAVSIVAKECGVTLSLDQTIKKEDKFQKEHELMDLVLKIYQNNLRAYEGEKAIDYLKKRNLFDETVKEFEIGLSLNKNILHDLLKEKKYGDKMLEELGLINCNEKEFLDVFRNRILFPIHDLNGYVVGFTGRCYLTDIVPKYLNTKETYLFKKGKVLFNYHRARDAIRLNKSLILVEGNMDAIRLSSVGIKNVVALMGTSLTKDQMEALKKLRVPLVLMLDNDSAGESATYSIGNLLEEQGLSFSVVRLSGAKDPDEYVVQFGKEAMVHNLEKTLSFMDFKLNYLKKNKNLDEISDLSEYIKSVLINLKKSQDDVLIEVTLQKLVKDYNISYDVLREQLGTKELSKKEEKKSVVKNNKRINGYDKLCEEILYYMMNGGEYIRLFQKHIGIFPIQNYRMIANEILYYYEKNKTICLADFITYMETNALKDVVLEIINREHKIELNSDAMFGAIKLFQVKSKEREIKEVKDKIKNELDDRKKMELTQKLMELKKEVF